MDWTEKVNPVTFETAMGSPSPVWKFDFDRGRGNKFQKLSIHFPKNNPEHKTGKPGACIVAP
jgi:hypothetical protein